MNAGGTSLAVTVGLLLLSGGVWAAQPTSPPCGTNGPLESTNISPSSYTYAENSAGSKTATFTVSSPPVNIIGACDASLPYVYGNGDSGSEIAVAPRITDVSLADGSTLTPSVRETLIGAFSFDPASFTLNNPGQGTQQVAMTFTNVDVPPGEYVVNVQSKMSIPEPDKGTGVGPANKTFTITVSAPQQVGLDTLTPVISINTPNNGTPFLLNTPLHLDFTAEDPVENGAGTGVWAMRAFATSCSDTVQQPLSGGLTIQPKLSVDAGTTTTATEDTTASAIGTFTLHAEADDNATPSIHTGKDTKSFSVGVGITLLPPVSTNDRQFNTGTTLPIKWNLTDANNANLSPFSSIKVTVTSPSGVTTDFVAGDGAGAIRWEVDPAGNAIQYLANYQIPKGLPGSYLVAIYVDDICRVSTKQGEFKFFAVNKGK